MIIILNLHNPPPPACLERDRYSDRGRESGYKCKREIDWERKNGGCCSTCLTEPSQREGGRLKCRKKVIFMILWYVPGVRDKQINSKQLPDLIGTRQWYPVLAGAGPFPVHLEAGYSYILYCWSEIKMKNKVTLEKRMGKKEKISLKKRGKTHLLGLKLYILYARQCLLGE